MELTNDRFEHVAPQHWQRAVPFPDGHFYSPVVSREEIWPRRNLLWNGGLTSGGIDYRPEHQRSFLDTSVRAALPHYDYPAAQAQPGKFYDLNPAFSWMDARALFTMLLTHRPQRMIEVGSGYSTLLASDVNVRHFNGAMEFLAIEPYPMDFLKGNVPGLMAMVQSPVQLIEPRHFQRLEQNDILFIDSSHVSKTGSDVNYLIFEVLPALKPGVLIHFHDVFLPREYPADWVFNEGRSWNEQYLLRALLIGSKMFEVEFGSSYVLHAFPDLLREVLGGRLFGGGSFWLRKVA